MHFLNFKRLNTSTGVAMTALNVSNGVAVYSEPINVERNVGYFSILIKEDKAGGAGDIDVYMQYSFDGSNWYRFNTTSNGVTTEEANIRTMLQNSTELIAITARLARYARVVVDPDADSSVTIDFAFQEQL